MKGKQSAGESRTVRGVLRALEKEERHEGKTKRRKKKKVP